MKIKQLFLVLLTATSIFAEGGSSYTRIGIGDLYYSHSAKRASWGGLGAAIFDKQNVSMYNPASWTGLDLARFETGVNIESIFAKDYNDKSFSSNTTLSGFILGIPIQKDYGISLVMGVVPYSRVKLMVNDIGDEFTKSFEGNGNVSKAFIGSSYILPFDINFGASLDYYIGQLDYYSDIIFANQDVLSSDYNIRYKFAGIGGTFGLISNDLSKTLGIDFVKNLRLGATFSINRKFSADTSLTETSFYGSAKTTSSTNASATVSTGSTKMKLPYRIGAGLSFSSGKYIFLMDYLFQPWSNYEFKDLKNESLKNLQKVSAGFEYHSTNDLSASFWESVVLRGGISYEQTQYKINGKEINQLSLTGGVSFPLDYGSTIDLAAEYGFRGTTDMNLVKENFFRFNLSVNFGELWFFRGER